MKKLLCFMLAAVMLISYSIVSAEEDTSEAVRFSDEEILEMEAELEGKYDVEERATGEVFHEKTKKDFNLSSPALYTGKLLKGYSVFSEKDTESKRLIPAKEKDTTVDILYVGLRWMIVRKDKKIGYVKREYMSKTSIQPVDPVHTPPFNVQKHAYIAITASECHVRKNMSLSPAEGDDGNNWVVLKPGTRISILTFYNGWAMVNYQREYGYIDPNELTDLLPVSPTDQELFEDCPIGAYTSYYNMAQTEKNINRIHNIKVGCGYISRVLHPGEKFDANAVMGPYGPKTGYKQAGVLSEGGAKLGYGGGTCQVSSTLYNVLIQLPGINITYRRPHGASGASYLPIHCDAAVGNDQINLIFINEYDFPIEIVAQSNDDGALCVCIYKYHGQ